MYRRVRFRSRGTVGYGPIMWVKSRKGDDVLHDHVSKACQRIDYLLCWQQSLVPRARDEENHFPARLNEAHQKEKFSSIGGYRNAINKRNKVLLTEWYNEVLN